MSAPYKLHERLVEVIIGELKYMYPKNEKIWFHRFAPSKISNPLNDKPHVAHQALSFRLLAEGRAFLRGRWVRDLVPEIV